MARSTQTSKSPTLLDRIARLPWWAAVLLAAGAYVFLHGVAKQLAETPDVPLPAWLPGARSVWKSTADLSQYIVPFIAVALAGLLLWRSKRREPTRPEPAKRRAPSVVGHLTLERFESQLSQALQLQGYQIVDNPAGGAGGRVDMVLRRDRETFLVDCKHWQESRVSVQVVQQLQRIMTARGVAGGLVVTSGRFSREATAFASGCNIRLIDGRALDSMIKRVQVTVGRAAVGASQPS